MSLGEVVPPIPTTADWLRRDRDTWQKIAHEEGQRVEALRAENLRLRETLAVLCDAIDYGGNHSILTALARARAVLAEETTR